jgi:outer membrane protein TolC
VRAARAGVVLVAIATGGVALADEPAPGAPPAAAPVAPGVPTPPPPGSIRLVPQNGVLRLRLADAVGLGMARNLEIAAGSYDPAIACEDVVAEAGEFDPLLTLEMDGGRRETPAREFLVPGVGVIEEELFGGRGTLSQKYASGGQVSLILSADRVLTNSTTSAFSTSWLSTVAVEARQPLLRGAGDAAIADLRRARVAQRAAEQGFRDVAEDVILRIEEAYWDLVFLAEQVDARRKAEDVASGLLDIAKARLDAQVASPLEVSEATSGLEERRGERILAEGLRGVAEDRLRALILPFDTARTVPIRLVPVDDPRAGVPAVLPGLADEERHVATALRRRPDLLRAFAELERNDVDVAVARDELQPQLDLVGRLASDGLDGTFPGSADDVLGGEATTATLGVTFSVYLGRRTAKARMRIAEYSRRQAGLRVRELENQVVLEVREALRGVATAHERARTAAEEIRAARATLEGERTKVGAGASTPFDVLQREERVTQAVTREGRAAADVRIALARLWRATGLLSDAHRVTAPSCAVPR